MNKLIIRGIWLLILIFTVNPVESQTLTEYWLGHGFSSGQTIYTNTGLFLDDGGYDLYGVDRHWNVKFCAQNGNPITVDFSGFRTDYDTAGNYEDYDYLGIKIDPPTGSGFVAYHDDTP